MIPILPMLLTKLAPITLFFKNKKRLVIEYILVAVVITVAGFTFNLWLQKERTKLELAQTKVDVVTLQSQLVQVEQINQAQENRITDLQDLRDRDSKALTGLFNDYKNLESKDKSIRKYINMLERDYESVRLYMQGNIPNELSNCLRNSKNCKTGSSVSGKNNQGHASQGTSSSVPSSAR